MQRYGRRKKSQYEPALEAERRLISVFAPRLSKGEGGGVRWLVVAIAVAGHGAVIAALMMAPIGPSAFAPPSVLAVKWVGEEMPAPAPPEPTVKPQPLPMKPRVQPTPRHERAPVVASAPAVAAPAAADAAPAPPVLAAATSAGSTRAEPTPVVAPRFDADYLSNPAPAYPPASRAMGEQGKVFLRVFVSPHGEALEVQVRSGSGHERLDLAALEAVRHWKFVPARQGAEAVAAWVIVPISFSLRR
jgi:periplasmic protein TonB